MTYDEAINYIHSIPKFRRPLGNANLKSLLSALGGPCRKQKFIHIAGTNGKGSTAAMTASILSKAGYKTGLFTSPFIEVFNERIQIDREMIGNDELAEYTRIVKRAMEEQDMPVSEFAFTFALAMRYFADRNCDFTVLEAGMGGRLDATNAIEKSLLSIITSISLDHTQYLGDTTQKIAYEKCGIIKDGGTVLVNGDNIEYESIKKYAKNRRARLITAKAAPFENGILRYNDNEYHLLLKGSYQSQNAPLALEAAFYLRENGIDIPDSAIRGGLCETEWKSRFEFLSDSLIIDGAHNPDAMLKLRHSLEKEGGEYTIVIAMMEDKNITQCIQNIAPAAKRLVAVCIDMPRCLSAEKLSETVRNEGYACETAADPESAVRLALDRGENVCVCGSLYLTGEIRKKFNGGNL